MDKKEARKILGVSKETTRNEIERRYSILLKKQKASLAQNYDEESENPQAGHEDGDENSVHSPQSGVNTGDQHEYTFEQITQAYNVLMGYEVTIKEEPPSKAAPLLKKAGIDEKKAKNFLYYYKFHILGIIIAIIAIVFTVRGCVNKVDYDFMTAFVGKISYSDTEKLAEMIKSNVPEIVEPGFDNAYLAEGMDPQMEYAMVMKSAVLFSGGDIDLFIMDKVNYEKFAKQGAFLSLDDIAPQLGVDVEKNREYIVKLEDDSGDENENTTQSNDDKAAEEHLYGIDISDSTVLKEAGIFGEEMIASIFVRCEQQEKAIQLLKYLME